MFRNIGITQTRTKYLFVLDVDFILKPNLKEHLQVYIDYMEQHKIKKRVSSLSLLRYVLVLHVVIATSDVLLMSSLILSFRRSSYQRSKRTTRATRFRLRSATSCATFNWDASSHISTRQHECQIILQQ